MKKVLSLLLSILSVLPLFNFPVLADSYEDNLILYYSFDNGANAEIGEDAQSFNISFSSTESVSGKAVFMDGNSSYLQLSSSLNESLSEDFTISTWAKFDTLNYWMRVFDFGADNTSYAFLGLSAPNDIRYAMLTDKTNVELNMTATATVYEDTWTHFTLVRKDEVMHLYVNGVLLSENRVFGQNNPSDIKNSLNYIGKSQFSADPYFHGYIDEFKVFNTALSKEEIVKNMTCNIKTELASYLPMHSELYDGKYVKENLNLVSFQNENTAISWSSSDESVISSDGKVVRHPEDKEVTLTATVTTNGDVNTFTYTIYVPSEIDVDAKITVDAKTKGVDINPDMVGLFFEDINYAADGGLYAELVQNHSFEAVNAQWDGVPDPIPSYSWTVNSSNHSYMTNDGLNENNTTYLRLTNPSATDNIINACYEGFNVNQGDKFDFSMFVRTDNEYNGKIMITLYDGDKIIGRSFLEGFNSQWTKYENVITAISSAKYATVKITLLSDFEGSIDFDMISLFPQNTWMNRKNGLRADLVQMLKDLHPGFLRFPGGCIIEGYNLSNRYSWKDTVGPVEERKENWNRWQLHTGGDGRYGYCQTYGLGFYEYFLLCEDIGAFPLPVVNVGIGCQYQTGDVSSMEELYSIYIQDALDLIEFANGAPDENEWAALRAEMGHPEPFNLEYIGIGNEQWETDNVNFFERYEAFEKAIHEKYPNIKLIATSGPDASGTKFDNAWTWLGSHSDNNEENFAYAVDEHYYRTPDWFYTNLDRYDGYDRTGYKVFAGEYASRYYQGKDQSNLNSALSVAAFMTSLEKNADIVALASYAPLFAREGYTQWYPDLIGFDEDSVFGTPDYYVQSMYANNTGSYTVENSTVNYKNSYTPHGRVGISTWGTSASFYDLKITDNITGETIALGDVISTGDGSYWQEDENGYTQNSSNTYAPALLFGTETMENYTFTLKAVKHEGAEGFLIPVMWEDENNYFTCNIGGWNNTYSAIQRTVNGSTSEYSVQNTTTFIETGREYEIKVTVEPHKLTVYLDGEVVNFASFKQNVYSTSSFDEETGDIIIKAVNTSSDDMETRFNITADYINSTADVTLLTCDDIYALNTVDNPTNISPISFECEVSEEFNYYLPSNSFTVFRIHTKDDSQVIDYAEDAIITITKGDVLSLPETVAVYYKDGSSDNLSVTWDSIPAEFTYAAGVKTVEGTVKGSYYVYADVTVTETDKSIIINPSITVSDNTANFSIAFSEGIADNFNVIAIVAAYSEDNTMTKIETVNLSEKVLTASIDLKDFLSENKVKLFLMNNFNYITDSVTVK